MGEKGSRKIQGQKYPKNSIRTFITINTAGETQSIVENINCCCFKLISLGLVVTEQ